MIRVKRVSGPHSVSVTARSSAARKEHVVTLKYDGAPLESAGFHGSLMALAEREARMRLAGSMLAERGLRNAIRWAGGNPPVSIPPLHLEN